MAFFNSKKPELKEEMRMRYSAPSFSFKEGKVLSLWSIKEAKENIADFRGRIVVLHPGINIVLNPRSWMKVLSSASYIIICHSIDYKEIKEVKREAERIIYALTPSTLSGVSAVSSEEEARTVLFSVMDEMKKGVVTINNTEGEL